MTRHRISKRLLKRLAQVESTRIADERRREAASAGVANVYRDRRDARNPFAQLQTRQIRKLYIALGLFLGLFVHLRFGLHLLLSGAVFIGLALFAFEARLRKKRERDKYFD